MPPNYWVARFVVEDGSVSEEGGLLRTFHRRRLDERDVDLYLLGEPAGGKAEDLGAQTLENVGRLFLEDRLSITGGLVRALKSTHQTLLDWNRRSVPRDQVICAVTTAMVSDTTVYLSQAGPGLAFSWISGRLAKLSPGPDAVEGLGEGSLEPGIRRFELRPGEMILGASPYLLEVVGEEGLAEILSRGADAALPDLYLLTRDAAHFQFFAVICMEPVPETMAEDDGESESSDSVSGGDGSELEGQESAREAEDESFHDVSGQASSEGSGIAPLKAPPMDISRPLIRLRSEQAMSPARYPRSTGPAPPAVLGLVLPRLLTMAAVVAIVALLAWLTLPGLVRESRGERVASLLTQAQAQLSAADGAADTAQRRFLLEEASSLAAEALRLDPQNITANAMRQQAMEALNGLNAVTDLGELTPLAVFSGQVTGDLAVESLELGGGNAYLLDTAGGRVLAVSLTAPDVADTVFQAGATYDGIPAQAPILLTWEGPEQDGRLLILDAERKLFGVRLGSLPEPLSLRRTGSWSSVAALDTYDGNLYVLDPAAGQVHRYFPAAGSFDSEPGPALAGVPDLTDTIDLDVAGDILILRRAGGVQRFQLGVKVTFELAGIDRPLLGPSAVVTIASANEVYVVDTGNKRIVVSSLEGQFLRQFVSVDFTELIAAVVDESGTRLYVVSGDTLFTAIVPR